jgi:serine-type D-Ala-D-Ala carboxypeptidase (penicillin-binding protein 5/6)
MKKILISFFLFFSLIGFAKAEDLASNAVSAVIMEYSTGKILYEKNANQQLAPASMTKIMTLLLTMEAIDNGKLMMDDLITISANAANMGGSQMFLEANSQVKVSELIKGISIASANDAAVALAETLGGSVDKFVEMMNNKANDLGLTNTIFKNPHGLDTEGHLSSAHDMAIMARALISHATILKFTSTYEDYFNKPDGSRTWLVNTNRLVRFYPGVDGLKTGYTDGAGYCLTATAMKNGVRYITVVMGEPTSDMRSQETTNLLNYAFNTYRLNTIINTKQELGKIKIEKGMQDYGTLVVKNDVTEVELNNQDKLNYSYNLKLNEIIAPVKNGDIVGSVDILDNEGLIIRTDDLTIKEDIKKATLRHIFNKNLRVLIYGKQ